MLRSSVLDKAVEVAKEAARGGSNAPEIVIKDVYNQIIEIAEKEGFLS